MKYFDKVCTSHTKALLLVTHVVVEIVWQELCTYKSHNFGKSCINKNIESLAPAERLSTVSSPYMVFQLLFLLFSLRNLFVHRNLSLKIYLLFKIHPGPILWCSAFSAFVRHQIRIWKLIWRIGDVWNFWMIPNWSKMSMSESFRINLVSFITIRHPLLSKPVSWLGLFFAISYSKTALIVNSFKIII